MFLFYDFEHVTWKEIILYYSLLGFLIYNQSFMSLSPKANFFLYAWVSNFQAIFGIVRYCNYRVTILSFCYFYIYVVSLSSLILTCQVKLV